MGRPCHVARGPAVILTVGAYRVALDLGDVAVLDHEHVGHPGSRASSAWRVEMMTSPVHRNEGARPYELNHLLLLVRGERDR